MKAAVLESVELRWFLDGPLPFQAMGLFAQEPDAPKPTEDRRPDLYVVTSDQGLGVKIRGDRGSPKLEVKTRLSRDRIAIGRSEGLLESWIKWSWTGPEDPFVEQQPSGRWVRVHKVRHQWKYSFNDDSIRIVPGAQRVEHGGAIEITSLDLRGRQYWTVAAEAFEVGDDARRMVELAAAEVLGRLTGFVGRESDSCGYSQWLALNTA